MAHDPTAEDTVVLRTKLEKPAASEDWVDRPRLVERIREGADRPLVLVSAPAGYGKTTILTQWAYAWDTPVAWLNLDDRDNDPFRFLRHLLAALPEYAPQLDPLLHRGQDEQYLLDVFETLLKAAEDAETPPRIVLDDYQVIHNRRLHEAIAHIVDANRPPVQILIGSRTDPPLPLARWRVEEKVLEIRGEDLRFGAEEIGQYLERVLGKSLREREGGEESEAAIRAIVAERTEGWIAGMKLACLSLQESSDPRAWVSEFSGTDRHILDYLLDEVLEKLPKERRTFLRRIAILDDVCGDLAEAVTGQSRGQETVEALERGNLFLDPLDRNRQWYRMHPLLRELLVSHLEFDETEDLVDLHHRAADWFESRGRPEEAAHHCIAAGEFARAAQLIDDVLDRVWMEGHVDSFTTWLDGFPEEVIDADPSLCIRWCWAAVLRGDVPAARARLERSRSAIDAASLRTRLRAAVVDSHIARLSGDCASAVEIAEMVLEADDPSVLMERGGARQALAMALFDQGHARAAHRAAEQALESALENDNSFIAMMSHMMLAHTHAACGRLSAAVDMCRRTIQESHQVVPYDPIAVYVLLARIHRHRDELAESREVLDAARRAADQTGRGKILPDLSIQSALLHRAEKEHDQAEAALVRADEIAIRLRNAAGRIRIEAIRARFALLDGDIERARRWHRDHRFELDTEFTPDQELCGLTVVRLRIAEGELDGLMEFLSTVHRTAEQDCRVRSMIEVGLLQALVRRAQNQVDQAILLVERALALAAPENFIRVFVDEGIAIEDLVRRARGRGTEIEHCDRVLESFERVRGESPVPVLLEPLTPRELEVLGKIESGLSNREIAKALHLAEATVKTHVNRLYRKLEVRSRTQAIAVARELKLL